MDEELTEKITTVFLLAGKQNSANGSVFERKKKSSEENKVWEQLPAILYLADRLVERIEHD